MENEVILIPFTKMHGTQNDFAVVTRKDLQGESGEAVARAMSHRRSGIGSDGILVVDDAQNADTQMIMHNPDGSQAMCGNGLRCFAKYVVERGLVSGNRFTALTDAGVLDVTVETNNAGMVAFVMASMGSPILERAKIPMNGEPADQVVNEKLTAGDQTFEITAVSMGNPHCVIFLDQDPDNFPVEKYGPLLEKHEAFPEKTNVEFAFVQDRGNIKMRVWERGAGLTYACGTGACATAVAAMLQDRVEDTANIHMPGGTVAISWNRKDNEITQKGPATQVFEGVFEYVKG